ncbi:hypothetical protein RLOatenuis_3040 [Rickettsiales bacterium]|nr:hypothetical protein RLOatenuis_3040 [Rickettsiales bacterium]
MARKIQPNNALEGATSIITPSSKMLAEITLLWSLINDIKNSDWAETPNKENSKVYDTLNGFHELLKSPHVYPSKEAVELQCKECAKFLPKDRAQEVITILKPSMLEESQSTYEGISKPNCKVLIEYLKRYLEALDKYTEHPNAQHGL